MARSFTLLRTLGEGAFGAVHLAEVREDDDFVQTLAVKWLHPRLSDDLDLARRLRDEARLLGLLRHEHIVRVHGLTRIEGRLAILMEPVDGVDLARLGRAPPRVALEICGAVADGLAAAWSAIPPGGDAPLRVVHRDIKPSNIMITARGAVKVMDFGVARATFDAREASTRSQQFGTARYMAPERWLDGVAEAPSDVYSLGVTLIELAGGEPVQQPRLSREGFAQDLGQALASVEDDDLRALAAAMCAFAPSERPTAAEVAQRCLALARAAAGPDLRTWAAEHVSADRIGPAAPRTGTVVVEDTPVPTADAPPPPPTPQRARPWPWVIATSVVLAVWIGVPTLRLSRPSAPPPTQVTLAPAPEPVAAPVPAPIAAPAVVAAEPAPAPRKPRVDVPPPEPVIAIVPVPDPEPPTSTVVFVLEPGLMVETPVGTVSSPRQALKLPSSQAHQLTVREGDTTWPCTITVGAGASTVNVRTRAHGGCRQ